ncbi:Mastermind-like protein 3 [Anabarilius grahami]|uniref:Mastermind-like protein 3 n=1 Tax=Anabarilius grahami TaxID=495550 RepID=A0A3N0XK38_ANAGA|nr:Mastermind-like protein 3 [Anabarilius grahami]
MPHNMLIFTSSESVVGLPRQAGGVQPPHGGPQLVDVASTEPNGAGPASYLANPQQAAMMKQMMEQQKAQLIREQRQQQQQQHMLAEQLQQQQHLPRQMSQAQRNPYPLQQFQGKTHTYTMKGG